MPKNEYFVACYVCFYVNQLLHRPKMTMFDLQRYPALKPLSEVMYGKEIVVFLGYKCLIFILLYVDVYG